jgi:hypothetical protein
MPPTHYPYPSVAEREEEEEREPPAKRAARAPADKLRAEAAEETFVVVEDNEFGEDMAAPSALPQKHR